MQFFLYEVVARVVAAYLCFDCGRTLWNGYVEGKITAFRGRTDILDWLLDWSTWSRPVFQRDTAPVRYWIEMGIQTILMVSCAAVAILGWWHPDS
jgi:hypothetical protein